MAPGERSVVANRFDVLALFKRLYRLDPGRRPLPWLPVVTLFGPHRAASRDILDEIEGACLRAQPHRILCARPHLANRDGARGCGDLLHELVRQLGRTTHPQFGTLTFPRYTLGRWMLDQDLHEVPPDERHARMRDLLCRRRQGIDHFSPSVDYGGGAVGIALSMLSVLVTKAVLPSLLRWKTPLRRRIWGPALDWYEDERQRLELTSSASVTSIALEVNEWAREKGSAPKVDHLLVAAFLADLRAGYDPGLSRRARSRTAACVVLLSDADARSAVGCALLDLVAEVRARDPERPDPVLFIATSTDPLPRRGPGPVVTGAPGEAAGGDGDGGDPNDSERRADTWLAAWHEARDAGSGDGRAGAGARNAFLNLRVQPSDTWETVLRIRRVRPPRLPSGAGARRTLRRPPTGSRSAEPLYDDPRIDLPPPAPPPARSNRRLKAVAGAGAGAVLLASYAALSVADHVRTCHPASFADPVGLARHVFGDPPLTTRPAPDGECIGLSDGSVPFGPATAEVEAAIHAKNEDVLAKHAAEPHPPYATIVVLTTLTSPTTEGKSIAAGLNELRGAYRAQKTINGNPASPDSPRLRLVIANEGGNSQYAVDVAKQITQLIAHDKTVVAVTGLGQSRGTTAEAIDILSAAKILLIGSVTSADHLAETPYFFRVSPLNQRQTDVAAAFALSRWSPVRDAVVLTDPDDAYSVNLAKDFVDAFSHAPSSGGTPARAARRLVYHAAEREKVADEMLRDVKAICRDKPDLVYYAGRSNEFKLFIDYTKRTCPDLKVPVIGGDDLENLSTPPESDFEFTDALEQFGPVYYTAWAVPDNTQLPGGGPGGDFYRAYRKAYGSLPSAHAVLAYDAVDVVGHAVDKSYYPFAKDEVTREEVIAQIRAITEDAPFSGASGLIQFTDDGHPYDKTVVVLELEAGREPRLVAACGLLETTAKEPHFCPPPS